MIMSFNRNVILSFKGKIIKQIISKIGKSMNLYKGTKFKIKMTKKIYELITFIIHIKSIKVNIGKNINLFKV